MADLIGTEKDAKDISGANVVIEDKKCITKARALEIGAAVENDSSYANNQLVCQKDLKANIRFQGYSVLNTTFSMASSGVTYDIYPLITRNYLLTSSSSDLLYGHKKLSTFTYNGSKIIANTEPEIQWTISGNVIWGIVRGTDYRHIYCYYDTIDLSGNFTPSQLITITESSYDLTRPINPWAQGDSLYFFASTYDSTCDNEQVLNMFIYKVSHSTGTYTRINVSQSVIGLCNGSTRSFYPRFNRLRSLPNKNGVFVFIGNVTISSNSYQLCFMLVDYNKLRTSAICNTSLDLPISIPNCDSIQNDWIDDGTVNGSWLLTWGRSNWNRQTLVLKITNQSFSSGGTVAYTNLSTTFSAFTGRNGESFHSFTFAFDKKRNRYYVLGATGSYYTTKTYLYTSTNLTSLSYVRDLDEIVANLDQTNTETILCITMNVSSDGEYLIIHGNHWYSALELTSGNYTLKMVNRLDLTTLGFSESSSGVIMGRFSTPDIHQGPACNPNGYDYIDLGLPSGTLWARTNVGATQEYQVGNTYSFSVIGEAPSSTNVYNGLHNSWGGDWKIPTKEQWAELAANTNASKVTQGGYTCLKCTSKTNSNYILLPLNLSSSMYYAYYPAGDRSDGGWYVQVWETHINADSGSAFSGTVYSPVRGVLLPSKIDYN